MMNMRVLIPFAIYSPGQILENVGGGVADMYIRRGLAERLADVPVAEAAIMYREHRTAHRPMTRKHKK